MAPEAASVQSPSSTTDSPQPQKHQSQANDAPPQENTNDTENAPQSNEDGSQSKDTEPEGGYPEQKHAGAVGLGPDYGKGAGGGDKITGFKEEFIGKITGNHDKFQHGHDMRTGELKRREREAGEDDNPFSASGKNKDSGKDSKHSESKSDSKPPVSDDTSHPTDKGAKEQAATTAPEGTEKAENQKEGDAAQNDKQIG